MLILIAVGVFLLWLTVKIFAKPIGWVLKLLLNALLGFVALFVLNFFGDFIGLHIDVNWISSIVTGVFGVPGIAVLLILQYLL